MAIGTSLDLKIMLRTSVSTLLRKLNCQAGGVHLFDEKAGRTGGLQPVFSIPRDAMRIEAYSELIETQLNGVHKEQWPEFSAGLPLHIANTAGKHFYIFELQNIGVFILMKNERSLDPLLIKSLVPLFNKLATACRACIQNQELIDYRNNLETLIKEKTEAIVSQNIRLLEQIRERQIAEAELRESEERYAAVVKQADEGIFLLDPDTKYILDSNESIQKMLGYSQEEMLQLQAYDYLDRDPEEIDTLLTYIASQDEVFLSERPYISKEGKILPVEISIKLIGYSGKKVLLVIARDTTEKKRVQQETEKLREQLRRAQKFEALGTLAGSVAHDLNNILSGIVGYPELLLKRLPADSELKGALEAIHDSGKRAATIVADLLTIARSAASTREVHDLNELIREISISPEFKKINSEHPQVSYSHLLNADQATIFCSPVHIKKCLMNLVVNGMEAISGSGHVTITTTTISIPDKQNDYSDLEPGNYVRLKVQDTGAGIPENVREHIFEPFVSRKEMGRSGTGLGLTVVWNTVLDHEGRITIDSSSAGSTFTLLFPIRAVNPESRPRENQSRDYTGNNDRILVIDDEPVLRDIAAEMLTELGYTVETVSSGEEAIQYIRKQQVDLLLIDMLMGSGMNGRQTYEEIIKICPDIKAVIASGFSESDEVKKAIKLGAEGFIQKPYTLDQLGMVVKNALTG